MPGLQRVIASRHSSGATGNSVGTSWQASCLTYSPTSKCIHNGDRHPFAPHPLGNNLSTFRICPSSDAPKPQAGAHLDAEVRRVQRGRRAHQGAQLARLARRRTLLLDRQQRACARPRHRAAPGPPRPACPRGSRPRRSAARPRRSRRPRAAAPVACVTGCRVSVSSPLLGADKGSTMLSASMYRTAARHSGRHARAGNCLDERSVGEGSQVRAPAHRRRANVRAHVPASALLTLAGCTGTRTGRARAPHRLSPAPNSVMTPAWPAGVSSAQPDSVSAQHAREPRVRPLAPCTKQRSPPSSATPAV